MDDRPGADRKIVPDSGRHELAAEACGDGYEDNGSIYDGVRDDGRPGQDTGYYEPDGEGDGDGYTPDRDAQPGRGRRPHADVTVRDFPGLFEDAQQPFEAVGLGMPWYSAFGNHDALVQGNSREAFVGPFGDARDPETLEPGLRRDRARVRQADEACRPGIDAERRSPRTRRAFLGNPGVETLIVPPDERRCFLAKDEPNTALAPCGTGGWIQQHKRTTGCPVGHGFEPFAVDGQAGRGPAARGARRARRLLLVHAAARPAVRRARHDHRRMRAARLRRGLGRRPRSTSGSRREIDAAAGAGQYVIVFSHHTLRTTRIAVDRSVGARARRSALRRATRPRARSRRSPAARPPETTLEDLFCRHENLLGARQRPRARELRAGRIAARTRAGKNPFVEVSTAAHIDWPQQSRTIELLTDEDGDLSLALTILDHAGPPNPGGGNAGGQPVKLASIAREIAYNDYQGSRGARGEPERPQRDRRDRQALAAVAVIRPLEIGRGARRRLDTDPRTHCGSSDAGSCVQALSTQDCRSRSAFADMGW